MTLEQLQDMWYQQKVRVKSFYKIPDVDYVVTACVEGIGTNYPYVFAVKAVNYTLENKRWYTIYADSLEDLKRITTHFEIINE